MTEPSPELDLWEISDSRRIELGKRWKDVLAETGLSHETLNRWRKGYNVDPFTDRSFEKSLLWTQGAREAIAAGRLPDPLSGEAEGAGERSDPTAPQASPTLEQELELATRLMAAQVRELGLSPEDAEKAWRRAHHRIAQSHGAANPQEGHPEAPRHGQVG